MTREALVLLVAIGLAGCTSGAPEEPRSAAAADTSATVPRNPVGDCTTTYPATVLPEWARAGFSEPDPSVPHVIGDNGNMAAIVWVAKQPLAAPPAAGKSNKILWVARVGGAEGALEIRATLEQTGQKVSRTVEPAPGPSIIDLPSAGCWSFDLTWGSHRDHLLLGYAAG